MNLTHDQSIIPGRSFHRELDSTAFVLRLIQPQSMSPPSAERSFRHLPSNDVRCI